MPATTKRGGMKKGYKYPPEHRQWNKGIDNRIERECASCGKKFKIYPSLLKTHTHNGNFCSRQCYYDACTHWAERAQMVDLSAKGKTAQEIGIIMGIPSNDVPLRLRRLRVRGGKALPSMGQHRLRTVLKESYGIDACEICDYKRITEVAHILEVSKGGRFYPDNCLLLCPNCHSLFDHNGLTQSEKDKLLAISRLNSNLTRRLDYVPC